MQTTSPKRRPGLLLLGILFLAQGCTAPAPIQETSFPTRTPEPAATVPAEIAPVALPVEPTAAAPTATFTPTRSPTEPVPTDPYAGLTIADLSERTYGGGGFEVEELLEEHDAFRRYLVHYISDGLMIYGFMDVPAGEGPFPVIVALHGYIDPQRYQTLDYTTRYADSLARAGYLVIHPNLRGYPPSEDGPNLFRVGFAVDALNLISIVKSNGGQPGVLEKADPTRIGLWGHSMGGGVSLRVLTVSPDVKAAVLYGAMSGDDRQNYEWIYSSISQHTRGLEELGTPVEAFDRISPIYFIDRINAAVSIHHGEADDTVPPAWSADLCGRLEDLGKQVECFTYPGQPHTFQGQSDQDFMQRTIEFFDRTLRN